jgi:hypothetical protein
MPIRTTLSPLAGINAPEMEDIAASYIFGRTARHDRDAVKLVLIHNVSDLGRETKRSAFDGPTGETDGPCSDALFRGYVGVPGHRHSRRHLARREGLSIGGTEGQARRMPS